MVNKSWSIFWFCFHKFYLVENSERQENGIRDEAKWDGAVVARI